MYFYIFSCVYYNINLKEMSCGVCCFIDGQYRVRIGKRPVGWFMTLHCMSQGVRQMKMYTNCVTLLLQTYLIIVMQTSCFCFIL